MKVHDTDTGREIISLEGSDSNVSGAAWSPDGLKLAAWGSGYVRIWEATQGYAQGGVGPR